MRTERDQQKIDEIRQILDFVEADPNVPMPYFGSVNAFVRDPDVLGDVARAMAPCDKDVCGNFYELTHRFGSTSFTANFARDEVCEAVVIGTEEIAEKVIETVIPAQTRDIVEWVCPDSILDR